MKKNAKNKSVYGDFVPRSLYKAISELRDMIENMEFICLLVTLIY